MMPCCADCLFPWLRLTVKDSHILATTYRYMYTALVVHLHTYMYIHIVGVVSKFCSGGGGAQIHVLSAQMLGRASEEKCDYYTVRG